MTAILNAANATAQLHNHLAACFSDEYRMARERFKAIVARHGAPVKSYVNPRLGPSGETLSADVAWFGPNDATRVAVLTSATHGVEGFCGSGAQIDWLMQGGPASLPDGVAVLLVHALNPFGFAWQRRVNEDGVDLNRNGIDFTQPLPSNTGFAALREAFLPKELSGPVFEAAQRELDAFRNVHGAGALRRCRAVGQYVDNKNIYFGGSQPTWSRRTLETIIKDYSLAEREQVAVIDYHTGLGRFGYGEPICGSKPGEPGQARARAWYGESLSEPMLGTSTSEVIPGLTQYIWSREIGITPLTFIALEYGTYPDADVDEAMVEEAWLYAHSGIDLKSDEAQRIVAKFRRAYDPATRDWQEMVLLRSRQIIRQTLDGLHDAV
jgi:hypothetical protein